ncbi:sugar phosphate isomerase/epimerase family protein [Marinicrinis lubricantis]|uniref:Sugar phosphate isomerase/epimerase family protein n=1 Tax=Marinicrinis lubricantis TaxID=2086470 RepID=A0ABW1IVK6_9BACL
MIKGITGAGLGRLPSLKKFVELAAAYGFQAVDLDPVGLSDELGQEEAKQWLKENNMQLGSIGLPVQCLGDEKAFRSTLPLLARYAEAASALGCSSCCTYILPSTDGNHAQLMAQLVRRYRVCAEILEAYGMRLGLEYVGPHHLRSTWTNPFIWTMEQTLDLIAAIGKSNVGLLLDSYHWYTTGQTAEDLHRLRVDQIVHVHLNDSDASPEEALDNDRLYPGEGRIDLGSFLKALKTAGYQGAVSQEVLTRQNPEDPVETLFERSKRGYQKAWHAAGLE